MVCEPHIATAFELELSSTLAFRYMFALTQAPNDGILWVTSARSIVPYHEKTQIRLEKQLLRGSLNVNLLSAGRSKKTAYTQFIVTQVSHICALTYIPAFSFEHNPNRYIVVSGDITKKHRGLNYENTVFQGISGPQRSCLYHLREKLMAPYSRKAECYKVTSDVHGR